MKKIENYIHGKKTSVSQTLLGVFDPSTGEQISNVVMSDENDFQNLIESSKKINLNGLTQLL
tara:strand:+ start:452 stop:637 length:186 start_codon:yes stop_codon:yes gene_type:complete